MRERVNPYVWDNSHLRRNAIDAIEMGVEDAQAGTERRLGSAVRNISTGLLLLLKARLVRFAATAAGGRVLLSADDKELVWRRLKDGSVRQEPKSDKDDIKKTVDLQQTIKRLRDFDVAVDQKTIEDITKVRNEIEHYYLRGDTEKRMREVIGLATVFIDKFFRSEMGETPAEAFDPKIWQSMLNETKLFEELRASCDDSLKLVKSKSPLAVTMLAGYHCSCGSTLIEYGRGYITQVVGRCHGCGLEQEATTILEAALRFLVGFYDEETASPLKPVRTCERCHEWTYVEEHDECLICGP